MSGLAPGGETAVLAALTANAFVSLHSDDPGATGINEIAGGGYARQGPVTFTNSGSDPTVASNSAIVSFPTATAPWGTCAYFGVWTAASGGTFQGSGAITPAKAIATGDQGRFLAQTLTMTAN